LQTGSPMHISEGGTGIAEGFEPGEPVAHGDGPGRTFRGVPFPAAKARNDPACPSQGTAGMRVLLLGGTPFEDGLLEAEASTSSAVKTSSAGIGGAPSRAWTSCMMRVAARVARRASLLRPSAVSP